MVPDFGFTGQWRRRIGSQGATRRLHRSLRSILAQHEATHGAARVQDPMNAVEAAGFCGAGTDSRRSVASLRVASASATSARMNNVCGRRCKSPIGFLILSGPRYSTTSSRAAGLQPIAATQNSHVMSELPTIRQESLCAHPISMVSKTEHHSTDSRDLIRVLSFIETS